MDVVADGEFVKDPGFQKQSNWMDRVSTWLFLSGCKSFTATLGCAFCSSLKKIRSSLMARAGGQLALTALSGVVIHPGFAGGTKRFASGIIEQ